MCAEILCYARSVTETLTHVEDLLNKWRDASDTTEDWAERTLITEFLEDLHEVHKCLKR
jgi:uncharacterized protein with von Willebrand factor type A (vWA) domain